MLLIKNLSLNPLFSNINFEIEKGIIWILWPSGSGKTTFLKTIWWYIKWYTWEIIYKQNNNLFEIQQGKIIQYKKLFNSSSKKISVGFHFQDYNLVHLDVKTNIDLPFIISWYKKDSKWINQLINYFEISSLLKKQISKISQWEKERVSIVKALANKPKLLLLDEAWASLDERLKNKLYEFIGNYAKNNIILFISHDKEIIQKFNLNKIVYDKNFKILKMSNYNNA